MLNVLRGFTLCEQSAAAHPACATRDVERNDDPVSGLNMGDFWSDLFDHAHGFVSQDVASLKEGSEHLVEVGRFTTCRPLA